MTPKREDDVRRRWADARDGAWSAMTLNGRRIYAARLVTSTGIGGASGDAPPDCTIEDIYFELMPRCIAPSKEVTGWFVTCEGLVLENVGDLRRPGLGGLKR